MSADEVKEGCAVAVNGPVLVMLQAGMAVIECDDGKVLFFGDPGWGYVGEAMRSPDATALTAAQDSCPLPERPPMLIPPAPN